MTTRTITLLLVLCLIGCVPQQTMVWVNAHPEKHDFKQERFACLETAAKATPPSTATMHDPLLGDYQYDVNAETRDQLFAACMNAKDWTLQPAKPKVSIQPDATP